jgi:putative acetyltransferase
LRRRRPARAPRRRCTTGWNGPRERGIKRLHAEASEAARRFFLKRGFAVVRKPAFEIAGVPIHNYAVEKWL